MQHQHVRGCVGRHLMQQVAHGSSPDGAWVRGLAFECFSQDTQSWSGLEHSAPGQLSSMAMPQRRAACGAPDGPRWSRGRHRRGAGRGYRRTAETAARTMGTAGLASWQLHTYEKWPTHMKLLYILVPSGFFPTAPSVGCLADLDTRASRGFIESSSASEMDSGCTVADKVAEGHLAAGFIRIL